MNPFEEKAFHEFENEIKLYYCGKRYRSILHQFGPYDKDKYLIYFIKEGRATLTTEDGKTLTLSKGFFVNFPESHTFYRCDEGTPWTIKWIMADGNMIERYLSLLGVTKENPFVALNTYHNVESVFDEMYDNFDKEDLSSTIYCISLVHKLFSALAEAVRRNEMYSEYVRLAEKLIEENYRKAEFNVSMLAEKLGLHYNYFSILYKREKGISPVKAINRYRLQNACKMLKFTDRQIKEIAHNCGFADELYFSRIFKNTFGMSPNLYRKNKYINT